MAQDTPAKPKPWLIAAWPGMGNVAVIAAGYLVHELEMEEAGELPSRDHFDINEVEVKEGIIERPRLPRGVFFQWKNPGAGRNLIIFLGEAQPATGTYAYAHELVATAKRMGADRVVTFASMASGLHPADNPKVTGVATDTAMLAELRRVEVTPLQEGQIGGLNGVVLGAAADQGLPGLCLLAEIPFFAAAVPNPKAARIALSVFSVLAGIDISLDALNKYSAAMDKALLEAMEKIEKKQQEEGGEGGEGGADLGFGAEADEEEQSEEAPEPPQPAKEPSLDYATRNRIERLFQAARRDKSKAMRLKEELDRLGVFEQYEDRFLDLFRRAE
jgi:uncharacterized protein